MHEDTKIITLGRNPDAYSGAVNVPVFRASTILFPSMAAMAENGAARERGEQTVSYGRAGTPTTHAFENAMAELEGGYRSYTYPSGAAAVAAALIACTKVGDHILVVDCAYGPTRWICNTMLKRFGVETTYFDPAIGAGIKDLIRPNTSVVFVEAPGSHTFEMQDVPAIADAAHKAGAHVLMDNTWGTQLYFKAFRHGVDISIHAATKYVVGHSDAMLGLCTATKEAWPLLKAGSYQLGQCASPDDIYLAQRGLRTMGVRLRQHQASGLDVADWLRGRPEVAQVLHPGLPGAPGHEIWKRDFLGACGLFAIELQPCSEAAVAAFIDNLALFGLGASWGGYESLALPGKVQHLRTATAWPFKGPLVRLHIGLESVDDLKADLNTGFAKWSAVR